MEAMLNQTAPDVEAVDEFAARLIAMINDGAATIMVSLGHRSGLFDTMASLPPSTVETIAEVAELSERYVKEWLGAMTTAGIVGYDQERRTYCLPTAHAALLSRAAAPNNIAVTSQFVGVAAAVEEQMLGRLKDGGGTCYSDYTRFHEVMAEDSNQTVVLPLVEEILPIVPGLIERLTAGIEVVDIGCGAGSALMRLAAEFPQSSFTGIDLCHDAFIETQVLALKKRLDNIQFIAADVSEYDSLGEFDLITAFDAIHDQKDPLGAL
ncbi:MAG: class I SAM-dependent methyltransferase, partial [Pseudomonadota bacterium]